MEASDRDGGANFGLPAVTGTEQPANAAASPNAGAPLRPFAETRISNWNASPLHLVFRCGFSFLVSVLT